MPQAFLDAGAAVPTQVAGDGDGAIEPNEIWSLIVPLTNVGGAGATAISAVLSTSTAGVNVGVPNSAYPDLAVSASGNNATPYRFTVTNAAACGAAIQFTLTVTYTGGSSPQVFNFSLPTGAAGTPVAFSYTGAPVPIPDSPGANTPGVTAIASLPVASPGNLVGLTASIDGTVCNTTISSTTVGIDHTFANDLQIDLKSPAGTLATIINRIDAGGNNFCQILLDDTAGTSIQSAATAPFTGTWQPANPLSAFGGQAITGTWELHATDFFVGDTGNIRAWSLSFTPAVCDAPVLAPANVTATKSVTGTFTPGGAIAYTIVLTNNGTGAQNDNAGHEFTDTLPAGLTFVSASATSGTVTSAPPTVNWDGSIPANGGTVTITINATIDNAAAPGQVISNQGTVNYDSTGGGTNDATIQTDAPGGAVGDPTTFAVQGSVLEVPTLSGLGLLLAGLLLAAAALWRLRLHG